MQPLEFSLTNYRTGLSEGLYTPPDSMSPFFAIDPKAYSNLGDTESRRGDLKWGLEEIRKRTGPDYFKNFYPLQAQTLDYSARAFPPYRFILTEVMTEDWLATVDWGKFQRDHVLHQPLCGYVALELLKQTIPNGKTILDECVDKILQWKGTSYIRDFLLDCGMKKDDPILDSESPIARTVWTLFFKEAAYLAAVFHDIGYPWQYAFQFKKNLDGMNAQGVNPNRNAKDIVGQFGQRLMFHALNGYQKQDRACPSTWPEKLLRLTDSALSSSHGFMGAIGFLTMNDSVRRYPAPQSPLHLLLVEWVATAIMMHDMAKIYWGNRKERENPENPFLRLSFDVDPLSAFITLVDEIEDFERPTVSFSPANNGENGVSITYGMACHATELNFKNKSKSLEICYCMTTPEDKAMKLKSLHEHAEHDILAPGMATWI
ncbi:MAG: hypothetical protein WC799_21770 [Desulfobacteraceae bacterium]|jgi:hypothetical protein